MSSCGQSTDIKAMYDVLWQTGLTGWKEEVDSAGQTTEGDHANQGKVECC